MDPSQLPSADPSPVPVVPDGLPALLGFIEQLQHNAYGKMALGLMVLWAITAAIYFGWWLDRSMRSRLAFLGRFVSRRTSHAVRRRHGIADELPEHVMCNQCHSIYRAAAGACYRCGALLADASPMEPDRGQRHGGSR